MRLFLFAVAVLVAALPGAAPANHNLSHHAPLRLDSCTVVDGDSLKCGLTRVRIRYLYAAEGDVPAAERLQRMLDSGAVRIEPKGRDRYGRLLADLYVDDVLIRQADLEDCPPPVPQVRGPGRPRYRSQRC